MCETGNLVHFYVALIFMRAPIREGSAGILPALVVPRPHASGAARRRQGRDRGFAARPLPKGFGQKTALLPCKVLRVVLERPRRAVDRL